MVDYYKVLGVKRTASMREIKTAYRRLARTKHPDVSKSGSQDATQEFAIIADAYKILSNVHERARYDEGFKNLSWNKESVLDSRNPHAQRLRRVAAQRRWDKAVDRWLETERRETRERSQAVFTTVSLFLSTFIVAIFKPRIWDTADETGRLIVITLFIVGMWHLLSRVRDSLHRYTYRNREQQSIIEAAGEQPKPYSRTAALTFLVVGACVSFGLGLLASTYIYDSLLIDMAAFFDNNLRLDLLIYPPIAVLLVDTMHTVAQKIDPY